MPVNPLDLAYAHEDAQLATWGGRDLLRLQLLLDYSKAMLADSQNVEAVAAVRWSVLSTELQNETSVREFQIILAASLYAKALTLDQSRKELFRRVQEALTKCFRSGDLGSFAFDPWYIEGRALWKKFRNLVWPWRIEPWSDVEARRGNSTVTVGFTGKQILKLHEATLLLGPEAPHAPGGAWLRYRLPDADASIVLVPAAALVTITSVHAEIPEGRGLLLGLLHHINNFYGTPDRVTRGTDAIAVNAALGAVMQSGRT